MPAICDMNIATKISENLSHSFKKENQEKSFDHQFAVSAKQVLSAKIEYEPVASHSNTILANLQTKYIVLKPCQPALSNGESIVQLNYC